MIAPDVVMFSAPVPELIALMPSTPPVVVAALIVRSVLGRVFAINASTSSAYCSTRCRDVHSAGAMVIDINAIVTARCVPVAVMLSVPEPSVISINAISATRRGCRINREVAALLP